MRTMKQVFFVLLVAVVLAALLVPCSGLQPTAPADTGIKILVFRTDSIVYASNEEMTLFLSLYSPEDLNNVLIRVSGVKNTRGIYYVSTSSTMNLTAGENNLILSKQLPACSSCAGIKQGTYFINLSVAYDGEVIEATHSIAITQTGDQRIPVEILVEEAKRMTESENLTLLDLRTEEEYNAAHIKGAVLIPFAELGNRTEELNKSFKIVVYSDNSSNSTNACELLIERGFERVYHVLGGINAWNESGYPLVATERPKLPGLEAMLALGALLIVAYRLRR
ncbi:MAG: rhodanese-like domain-containing protein [Methanophagales archaeon ANME-1-THS]|nr:MAG: rhodanese-like domain-containing protein [Methanophagales archaeon ANME-1-THS]